MPDQYKFHVLVSWGETTHLCIEEGCTFPEVRRFVPEKERKAHALTHEKEREKERERRRAAALARARVAKKLKEESNNI